MKSVRTILFIIFIMCFFFEARFKSANATSTESKPGKRFLEEYFKARDPFHSPTFEKILIGKKDELEQYGIDSIKMIGILTGPDHLRAMLQIPDGKTFLVSERMKIGLHQGYIKKITPDEVIVREKVKNILGEDEYVDSEIPLAGEKLKEETTTRPAELNTSSSGVPPPVQIQEVSNLQ